MQPVTQIFLQAQTIEFKSYLQPLLILSIIPFGACGAIFGHVIQDLPFTLFSIYGLVALSGIVVNDSIVLIDFINLRIKDGLSLHDAVIDAGRRRCRPVLLTSLTTIGGMMPILLETSRQAQVLIPMATSLSFGLIFGTFLVLILAPVGYAILHRVTG
jgi:multidrug efflux pump subunit AcrB